MVNCLDCSFHYQPEVIDKMQVPSNLKAFKKAAPKNNIKCSNFICKIFVTLNSIYATGILSLLHVIYKILNFVNDPKVNLLNNVLPQAVKTARYFKMKHLNTHRSSRNTFQPQNRTKIELHILMRFSFLARIV